MAHPSEPSQTPIGPSQPSSLEHFCGQSQVDFELNFFAAIIRRQPAYVDVIRVHAKNLSQKGLYEETLEIDRLWVRVQPEDPLAHYNLACSYALTRQTDKALSSLRQAIECGYHDFRHIRQDRDLDSIRDDPRFRQLLLEFEDV